MKKYIGDSVATMTIPEKSHKRTTPRGSESYRDVEILRPAVAPSVDPAKIVEAVVFVMNNDKPLRK